MTPPAKISVERLQAWFGAAHVLRDVSPLHQAAREWLLAFALEGTSVCISPQVVRELYLAAVVALGVRMFNNLGIVQIRRGATPQTGTPAYFASVSTPGCGALHSARACVPSWRIVS